jgi:hypothetical protein
VATFSDVLNAVVVYKQLLGADHGNDSSFPQSHHIFMKMSGITFGLYVQSLVFDGQYMCCLGPGVA